MKKVTSIFAVLIIIASCNHDVSTPQNNNNNSNSTSITGNFIITKFTDDNLSENKTADFSGYTFIFTADGEIKALINNIASPGNYKETPSHEGEGAKLKINFSDEPLDELNKNWQIDAITDNAIHLSDDDASSGEVLEFTAQ